MSQEWTNYHTDWPPADEGEYLVLTPNGHMKVCAYDHKNGFGIYPVTHWRMLPKLPAIKELFTVGYSGCLTDSPMNIGVGKRVFQIHATSHSELRKLVNWLNETWASLPEPPKPEGPFKVHDSCDTRYRFHFGSPSVIKEIHIEANRIELERLRDWLNKIWALHKP